MSKLDEIEAAADALPPEQKQELMLFLGARLRAQGARLPEPRRFSQEQMAAWVEEDEADMRRFAGGKWGFSSIPASFWPQAAPPPGPRVKFKEVLYHWATAARADGEHLPHPTRFVEMTGFDRGKVCTFTGWIRARAPAGMTPVFDLDCGIVSLMGLLAAFLTFSSSYQRKQAEAAIPAVTQEQWPADGARKLNPRMHKGDGLLFGPVVFCAFGGREHGAWRQVDLARFHKVRWQADVPQSGANKLCPLGQGMNE